MKKPLEWMKAHAEVLISLGGLIILAISFMIIISIGDLGWDSKIQAIVTVILAYITFLYMRETKRMRKIAERALDIEAAPLVFMQKVDSNKILDENNKKLTLYEVLHITNVGKSPAYDLKVEYRLVSDPVEFSWQYEASPHLYPSEEVLFYVIPFSFDLSDKEVKEIGNRMGKPYALALFPMEPKPSFEIELKIKYLGLNRKPEQVSYLCAYKWDSNMWGLTTLQEKNDLEKPSHPAAAKMAGKADF